jgi:hypothetical protein
VGPVVFQQAEQPGQGRHRRSVRPGCCQECCRMRCTSRFF